MLVPCAPAQAGVALPSPLTATGEATFLGRITSVLVGVSCTVDMLTGAVSVSGTIAQTAANGDQLFATWSGTVSPGVLTLTNVTFTGGTGRFANAAGTATGSGTIDLLTGAGTFVVSGQISRPNS